jgi:uncharacterized protein YfaS (alpha-2-macroglobulin family)
MMARVLNGGVPVSGASVNFDALKPNGVNHVRLTATTNSNGDASASFISGSGPSSIGTYQLTTTATRSGSTATAYASFVVQSSAPQPATLIVNKVVVNNDGGSKVASDFSFSVNGAPPVAFESDGSNALSVAAGTYTVTEPTAAGYSASLSNCTNVVLASGATATCTITNNDTAGLAATTGSDKSVYTRGETVTLTAHAVRGGAPVSGAQVSFDALKPNGVNHVRLTATTDANGDASASFVSGTGPSSIGTYQLTTTVTSAGVTAVATGSFVVQ